MVIPSKIRALSKMAFSLLMSILLTLASPSLSWASTNACRDLFKELSEHAEKTIAKSVAAPVVRTTPNSNQYKDMYEVTQRGIELNRQQIYGNESSIHAIMTALIAREHAWINGDPGGAKTMMSNLFLMSEILGLVKKEGPEALRQHKAFVLQFHKLLTEGIIVGTPILKKMLEDGKYEIQTKDSLISDEVEFALLDEAEKASPSTHSSLLAILNERQGFVGGRVLQSNLRTAIFTSNKTVAKFKKAFEDDAPTADALLDRIAIKTHAISQQKDPQAKAALLSRLRSNEKSAQENAVTYLSELNSLMNQVKISESVLEKVVLITRDLDAQFTKDQDESLSQVRRGENISEKVPPNQFSIRSMIRLIQVMRASFLAEQLMDGVSWDKLRLEMTEKDLYHIATAAVMGGPGSIRHKSYEVEVRAVVKNLHQTMKGFWNPVKNTLTVDLMGETYTIAIDLEKGTYSAPKNFVFMNLPNFPKTDLASNIEAIKISLKNGGYDPKKIEFEDDGKITAYLNKGSVRQDTKNELKTISDNRSLLIAALNTHVQSEQRLNQAYKKDLVDEKEIEKAAARLNAALSDRSATQEERLAAAWSSNQLFFKELNLHYKELKHSIRAHFNAIASGQHIFSFGPPGGAKTALAREIVSAEIKNIKQDEYSEFVLKFLERLHKKSAKDAENFVLQFHKQMPEGVIVGYLKLNKQLADDGRLEYDRSQSLGNDKFIFALLDEAEKGNPAVLSSLLSVLNEREVFAGNERVKAALRTAVITSNKTPSEFIDSAGNDAETITALLARAINKIYVPNKFSEADYMADFLKDRYIRNYTPKMKSALYLSVLSSLANKVTITPWADALAAQVHDQFMDRRVPKHDQTKQAHEEDFRTNPHYYIQAASEADRTFGALAKQWKMNFILDQMINGVPFESIRYEISASDIRTFGYGLIYYGPFEMRTVADKEGVPLIQLDTQQIDKLINSPQTNERNQYTLQYILEEARDFAEIANQILHREVMNFRQSSGTVNFNEFLFGSDK